MCGIAGIIRFDDSTARANHLRRMVSRLDHRGPDAHGIHIDRNVGLGHARLSIIDLEGGVQPMHNAEQSISVTFNGEIFNYIELRHSLISKGYRFSTQSDTEVLLHAYAEYGEACVEHFNGQWAFAIWDRNRQKLFLSRDRFGIRPLFYSHDSKRLVFASEVKSLFAHGDVPRRIDPVGISQVFSLWTTLPPTTVFQGVDELPPGHNLIVEGGRLRFDAYWDLDYGTKQDDRSESECARQLFELLSDATRLRLRSDVPLGAYLSGGLDSSVTTALVKHCTNQLPKTFSVTFQDPEFDESIFQQQLVDHLGTNHQSIRCSHEDIARVFPDVVRHTEKPVLRTAPAPLFMLSRLVHDQGFKVVVTGEGADEMLGGYDIFKEAKVRRFCAKQPESSLRPLMLQQLYPYLPNIQAQSLAYRQAFFQAGPDDLANPLFSHLPRWNLTSRLKLLLSSDYQAAIDRDDVIARCRDTLPRNFSQWDPLCQAQYLETTILMPGYILSSQGDRMAMAHSVEGRFPFLDHRVAEFAAKLPPRMKMKALDEKHILKKATAHLIPDTIVKRKKQPYRAPDAISFFDENTNMARQDYVDELLSDARIQADQVFNPQAVSSLVNKAKRGSLIGIKDNMALVGVLSTQLVIDQIVTSDAYTDCKTDKFGVDQSTPITSTVTTR